MWKYKNSFTVSVGPNPHAFSLSHFNFNPENVRTAYGMYRLYSVITFIAIPI